MFQGLTSLYSVQLPMLLVIKLHELNASPWRFVHWLWVTKRYTAHTKKLSARDKLIAGALYAGMFIQILAGVGFLLDWVRNGTVGAWEFGAALLISYPIVWAHLLAVAVIARRVPYYSANPKKLGRAIVCAILEYQVRQLRSRHAVTVVAVAGSVGKTSIKLAIADLLGQSLRVRHQSGNYNDRVTVPLVFFGQDEPSLFNAIAWLKVFRSNAKAIHSDYPYDIVVVELGTDGPGYMEEFAYIKPDITVVTAISPEHMEYFKTLDAVAAEELTVFEYSKQVLVNGDDIAGTYLAGRSFVEYSTTSKQADYYASTKESGLKGQKLTIKLPSGDIKSSVSYIGTHGAKFALAATAVADMLKVPHTTIVEGLPVLKHFAGRMQILPGIKDSTLIDDTYNASPIAVCAALDVLYAAKTTQRIAILGGMNELGEYSKQAHEEVGAYCDAKKLNTVITIGTDAEKWLAPAAKKAGCKVVSFKSPYEAGEYAKKHIKKGAVVLAKGSQNGVFAEESLKSLFGQESDTQKLVRQSKYWLDRKATQFPH